MSASKRKGTAAESAVVRYLKESGFAQAERRALAGSADRGDIAGLPGVVIEVKNHARLAIPAWVAEAETERLNDGARYGVVWHKAIGKGHPADWFVTMTGAQFVAVLRDLLGAAADSQSGGRP